MAPYPPTTDLNVLGAVAVPSHAADPTPPLPAVYNHLTYAKLITDAIASLNERDGSSKRAISKYIEAHHSNLPPSHSSLLTIHLKQLRDDGQLLIFKKSYKLARSPLAPPVSVNGADSVAQKKRPGRPPKRKSVQDAVPVFGGRPMTENPVPDINPQVQNAATGPLGSAIGQVGGPVVGGTPRGRGRPHKQDGFKRGRGRPIISGGVQVIVGRSKGRPKKNAAAPVMAGTRRGRGRPRKVANVNGGMAAVDGGTVGLLGSTAVVVGTGGASTVPGGGLSQVAGKRRGRPPKSGNEVKMPRKVATGGASIVAGGELSEVAGKRRGRPPKEDAAGSEVEKPRKLMKPLGRPKKNASTAGSQTPVNPQRITCLDLKGKLQYFQSRIKHTASIIKPHLNSETASTALQELETLAEMDVNTPLDIPLQC